MENIYFELRNKTGYKYGVVENIPDNTSAKIVKERIEVDEDGESIKIVTEKDERIDIFFDWSSLDFEGGLDEELLKVDEILEKSIDLGIEDRVVFTALSIMKKDSKLSISEVIEESFKKLTE